MIARASVGVTLYPGDLIGSHVSVTRRLVQITLSVEIFDQVEGRALWEAARKTAVKLLFPLIFCIFPALMVVILAPAMIQVIRTLMDSGGG